MFGFLSAWLAILLYHAGILVFLAVRRPEGLGRRLRAGMKSPLVIPGMVACAMAALLIYFMRLWFVASELILPEWMFRYGLTGWA